MHARGRRRFAAHSTPAAPGEDDHVGEGDPLPAALRRVERGSASPSSVAITRPPMSAGVVRFPVLLRREPDAGAVCAAALVGAAVRRRRRPCHRDELGHGEVRVSRMPWP